jgi:hypothetical protein
MALVGARRGLGVQRWLDRKRDDRKIERMLIAYRRRYDSPGVLTGYWPSADMGLTGVLTLQLVAYKPRYAAQCFRQPAVAAKFSCSEPMAAGVGPLYCCSEPMAAGRAPFSRSEPMAAGRAQL